MKTYSPALEPLEKRLAPAGVAVSFTGGALKITGTDADDFVMVEKTTDGFTISVANGSMISLNGGAEQQSVQVTGAITKGVQVDLKGGNDTLSWDEVDLQGNMTVAMGAGDNETNLTDTVISGNLSVTGLEGKDSVSLQSLMEVTGTTALNLGDGTNFLATYAETSFGKGLTYIGGSGLDVVWLTGSSVRIGGLFDAKMGAGDSDITIDATTSLLKGVNVLTLDHSEATESADFSLLSPQANILGPVTIKNGLGPSTTSIQTDLLSAGKISITNQGGGVQNNSISVSTDGVINGGLTILNGSGFQTNSLSGSLKVVGNVSVTNAAITVANQTVSTLIAGSGMEITGNLSVINKTAGVTNISGYSLEVTKGITITNGDLFKDSANSGTVFGIARLSASSLTIKNGVGSYTNQLNGGYYQIAGNFTIINGANVDGSVLTSLSVGSIDVGGAFSITNAGGGTQINQMTGAKLHASSLKIVNGHAADTFVTGTYLSISQIDLDKDLTITTGNGKSELRVTGSSFDIGGKVSIVTGNASDGLRNTVSLEGNFVSVGGSLNITNGNGLFDTEIVMDSLSVKGAVTINGGSVATGINSYAIGASSLTAGPLSITSKGGDTRTTFEGDNFLIRGALTITHGEGTKNVSLDVGALRTGGNFALNLGKGQSTTAIEIGFGGMNVGGAFLLNALEGNDTFGMLSEGNISKGMTFKFGAGSVDATLQAQELMLGSLNITHTTEQNTNFEISGVRVNGASTITGSKGGDDVLIKSSTFRGALKIDLKEEADTLEMNSNTYLNAVNLLTGAGADTVKLAVSVASTPANSFSRSVLVDLGADDNTLKMGIYTDSSPINLFHNTVKIISGTGTTSRELGSNVFYHSDPQFVGTFADLPVPP